MNEKKRIRLPIIVEGRYDKAVISSLFSATVITTEGFSIFNSKEKQQLIRRLAEGGGVILLTDSDGGGVQIRSFLSGILPKDKIFHLYIPQIEGKEGRKKKPSKAGFLGVEGMKKQVLYKIMSPFFEDGEAPHGEKRFLTALDLYNDGFTGKEGAEARRTLLLAKLGLPSTLSKNALIEAVNLLSSYEEYKEACEKISDS